MLNCPKCGKKNDDDAKFCQNCGVSLGSNLFQSSVEKQAKKFAQNVEKIGKKAGKTMVKTAKQIQADTKEIGKHVEQRIDRASTHIENWYDRTFGVLGPLLSSFVFLIIFRFVIEALRISGNDVDEMRTVAVVLLNYLLPLFGTTLLSNYTQYFSRKSFKFKVFSPLFYAIALVISLWIVVKILRDLGRSLSISSIGTAAVSIENSLSTIFIFVLLIGYMILAMTMPQKNEGER